METEIIKKKSDIAAWFNEDTHSFYQDLHK